MCNKQLQYVIHEIESNAETNTASERMNGKKVNIHLASTPHRTEPHHDKALKCTAHNNIICSILNIIWSVFDICGNFPIKCSHTAAAVLAAHLHFRSCTTQNKSIILTRPLQQMGFACFCLYSSVIRRNEMRFVGFWELISGWEDAES